MRKLALAILLAVVALVIPACADRQQSDTPSEIPSGTIKIPVQLINIVHDGHLYVVGIYNNGDSGGSFIHSPNCPYGAMFK